MRYLKKTTRRINRAFVHSTATKASRKVTPADIHQWHVIENGWSAPGYHGLIQRDGTFIPLRPTKREGAHTRGHNTGSLGIVMAGGISDAHSPEANFTRAQLRTLKKVIAEIEADYPGVEILGHRDVAPTACPSFDVKHWHETNEVRA